MDAKPAITVKATSLVTKHFHELHTATVNTMYTDLQSSMDSTIRNKTIINSPPFATSITKF
jgi:hypothetical protein